MSETFKPESVEQIEQTVQWALAEKTSLEVLGGGTKRDLGRPNSADHTLDLSAISGIVDYEPKELVMSARPATPLAEIAAAMEPNRQQLAFEPADYGRLLGVSGGGNVSGTIGGAFACNLTGPRRIRTGSARDHILGFEAVNGRGESFKSGGRMFKNVTGFDFSKLMCGSFGTLAVITELTFKVLPAAETTHTVLVFGADAGTAVHVMTAALQSPYEISGAAFLPASVAATSTVSAVAGAGTSVAAIRVEGFGPSVEYRCGKLGGLLAGSGETEIIPTAESKALWAEIRDVSYFLSKRGGSIWRLSVPPTDGASIAAAILESHSGEVYFDWGGGLIWLFLEDADAAGHETVRGALSASGGHATLIRADAGVRAAVPVFQPQPGPLAAVTARVKESFDPNGVFNPGRMYADM
jgi:glycolate dehydrogenase FAD-binding subunit